MEKIRTRAEVNPETTWDLRDLFVTDVEWEQELRSLPQAAAQIETFKGRLGEGAEQLLACLDAREALQERIGKTTSYARLKQSEDSTNPVNIENSAKAGDILSNLSSSLSLSIRRSLICRREPLNVTLKNFRDWSRMRAVWSV